MLNELSLEGVGPASSLYVNFQPRLNFLTGDNGLGKSFILDTAWWALTRTWARSSMAVPRQDAAEPKISYVYTGSSDYIEKISRFNYQTQQWTIPQGRPGMPGVVIYAGVDGSFSVWDPARNYWSLESKDGVSPSRPKSFDFRPEDVWYGLLSSDGKTQLCNGLISDWVLWQEGKKSAFDDLVKVLDSLSPSGIEKMTPGNPIRIGDSVKDLPSLRMPYGQDVPLPHASSGMRRIAALAYLLVWTWREHQLASERFRVSPAREIIFLIDEIECHLHPQWQRRIVPALLNVMNALTGTRDVPVQLLAATHSPLVLASIEPVFDPEIDSIWDFDLVEGEVKAELYHYSRKGDVNAWLSSKVFDLKEPTSVEAEEAKQAALHVLAMLANRKSALTNEDIVHIQEVDCKLRSSLSDVDPFWIRWSQFYEQHRGEA